MDSTLNIPFSTRESGSNDAPVCNDPVIWRFAVPPLIVDVVPTATTQVVLTQVFAPQGRGTEELNALSAYISSMSQLMLGFLLVSILLCWFH